MSRSVTGSVLSCPWITLPSESPISSVSTPAFSSSREARVVAREHRDLAAFLRHFLQRSKRYAHVNDLYLASEPRKGPRTVQLYCVP